MSNAPIENMFVTYFLKQSIAFDEQNVFPCYCLGEMVTFFVFTVSLGCRISYS